MDKPAPVDHPIFELLARRFSPRAFVPEALPPGMLDSLFEAARWAPSCFNEQPWRFVVAERTESEAFSLMVSCLNESNQLWARNAGALVLSVARSTFTRGEKANAYAWHDVGMATLSLTIEATARGLGVHQMAGFDSERAREALNIPQGFDPVAMVAVGKTGEPDILPEPLAERERAPRSRKALSELVFRGRFG